MLLYEGLPSEFWEPELREQELNQAKTIKLHGYPFYEEPIALKGTDAEPIDALFSSGNRSNATTGKRDAAATIRNTASNGEPARP